ncbi:hypothetical protein ACQPZA_31260 [Pseudonocardia xinjiangensis]|uniref:hypothetical protein n=1 Tax=Pseudonocardia xinjiangensis TaxID=75289 RepID=UPI003D94A6B8
MLRTPVGELPQPTLTVEVHNTASGLPPVPGLTAGLGLAGLTERVALAGGRLEHRALDQGWRVSAWLPHRAGGLSPRPGG